MPCRRLPWLALLAGAFLSAGGQSAQAAPAGAPPATVSPLEDYKPYVVWKNAEERFSVRPEVREEARDWTDPNAPNLPERLTFMDFAKLLGQQGGWVEDPNYGNSKPGIAFRQGMWYLTPTSRLTVGFRYDMALARQEAARPVEAVGPLPVSVTSRLAGLTRFKMLYRLNERVSLGFEYQLQEAGDIPGLGSGLDEKAETLRSDLQIRY